LGQFRFFTGDTGDDLLDCAFGAVGLIIAFPGSGGAAELGREAANVLVLTFVILAVRRFLGGTCRG
jgi:hypothetical protein